MVSLGSDTEGTATLTLPAPHDGDDLEIHLVYEIIPIVIEEPPKPTDEGNESEDTPALSMVSTVITVGLALAFSRKGRQDRRVHD